MPAHQQLAGWAAGVEAAGTAAAAGSLEGQGGPAEAQRPPAVAAGRCERTPAAAAAAAAGRQPAAAAPGERRAAASAPAAGLGPARGRATPPAGRPLRPAPSQGEPAGSPQLLLGGARAAEIATRADQGPAGDAPAAAGTSEKTPAAPAGPQPGGWALRPAEGSAAAVTWTGWRLHAAAGCPGTAAAQTGSAGPLESLRQVPNAAAPAACTDSSHQNWPCIQGSSFTPTRAHTQRIGFGHLSNSHHARHACFACSACRCRGAVTGPPGCEACFCQTGKSYPCCTGTYFASHSKVCMEQPPAHLPRRCFPALQSAGRPQRCVLLQVHGVKHGREGEIILHIGVLQQLLLRGGCQSILHCGAAMTMACHRLHFQQNT